jgi:pyruvate/2-oxoglutarate dehydrogenase complex dihydrolipoamide dehydrogenase (E3) component
MMIEDEDVSDEVAAILRDDGITVLISSTPVRVKPPDGCRVRLTVRTPDGEQQREGSHQLSAIGRIPNTEALTPEAAGTRLNDRGFIEVDEYLETSVPGVYAMGDVKGGPATFSFWQRACTDDGPSLFSARQGVGRSQASLACGSV